VHAASGGNSVSILRVRRSPAYRPVSAGSGESSLGVVAKSDAGTPMVPVHQPTADGSGPALWALKLVTAYWQKRTSRGQVAAVGGEYLPLDF
jgi:hypothetical protein